MPTITTVDATWDTGVAMDAAELRRADTAMFLGDGSADGIRGGIVYHGPTSLGVTVNGSDQVTVQAGAFVVPAATGLGAYRGALSAATAATAIAARNATNPRIDLVVIQVTGTNATVKTIEGTAAASPSAPALPAQHIELARLTVPAVAGGAVTVDSSWRVYACGLGGVLYVPTLARLPGSGSILGQRAVALDNGKTHLWTGAAWQPEQAEATSGYGVSAGVTLNAGRVVREGRMGVFSLDISLTAAKAFPDSLIGLPTGWSAAYPIIMVLSEFTGSQRSFSATLTTNLLAATSSMPTGIRLLGSVAFPLTT